MRVRTRRFRSGDQGCPPSHDAARGPHPWHPMLPIRVLQAIHSPIRGHRGRPAARWSGTSRPVQPFTRIETSGFFVSTGDSSPPARCLATMASADFPRHFLLGISPDKNVLLPGTTAAFTSVAGPMGFAVLCQLAHHVGLLCDFCPSAHRFPLAFLPPLGYPHGVGFT